MVALLPVPEEGVKSEVDQETLVTGIIVFRV